VQTDARTSAKKIQPPTVRLPAQGPRATYLSIERIHSRACTGFATSTNAGTRITNRCGSKRDVACFPRILRLYWLGFGVFKLGGVAAIRFRVDPPESNWLNLDYDGFGVSRRSVKNKMFCAHVISDESGLTTVSHNAVGRHEVLRCGLLGWFWESQRSPSSKGEGFARASRSPQSRHAQFGSQNLGVASSRDKKHLCPPRKFLIQKIVVHSHHNLRLFKTQGTIKLLEMRYLP
jgi:hypothetical protein